MTITFAAYHEDELAARYAVANQLAIVERLEKQLKEAKQILKVLTQMDLLVQGRGE